MKDKINSLEQMVDEFGVGDISGYEEEEGEGELNIPVDHFYSHLGIIICFNIVLTTNIGSLLSSALRHVITPPTPLFRTPYVDRVAFHFFVIKSHDSYVPLEHFDYDEYKKELEKLKLAKQEFTVREVFFFC